MLRMALLGIAHVHAAGYAAAIRGRRDATLAAVWDPDHDRARAFAARFGIEFDDCPQAAAEKTDAALICAENARHAELVELVAATERAILCEKPLATNHEDAERIRRAASNARFMTAFPCPYSPTWDRLLARIDAIGRLRAVSATNRGRCPLGWFVDPKLAGGGALADHTAHVADLLRRLVGANPTRVWARSNRIRLGLDVEDAALVAFDFPDGVFATLDASWSRPDSYRTWGDVTLSVVGDRGTIEVDLFAQNVVLTKETTTLRPYGSSIERLMIDDLVRMTRDGSPPRAGLHDGLAASAVTIAALESARHGHPVLL